MIKCQCLHRYKKKIHVSFCKCRSSSQEVVELVDGNVGIINSFKAQYRKSCIRHMINYLMFAKTVDLRIDIYQAMKMLEKVGVSMSLLQPFIYVRSTSI